MEKLLNLREVIYHLLLYLLVEFNAFVGNQSVCVSGWQLLRLLEINTLISDVRYMSSDFVKWFLGFRRK